MEISEYQSRLDSLEKEFELKKKNLIINFCKDIAKDLVKDNIYEFEDGTKLCLQQIEYNTSSFVHKYPYVSLTGVKVNKNGSLSKRGETIKQPSYNLKK